MTTTTARTAPSVRILAPGDDGWDAARMTFNLRIDQRPRAIALPRDAAEVAEAIAVARDRGLRVVPQGTGHGAGSLGPLDDALLLNTSRLTGVEIDAPARRVRVGAATRWRDVVPQLADLGLAALHGSSPDVGIAGYSLGGGIGWLARKHGMQANAVRAIELVTADGVPLRADHEHHAELFWALRGGHGNFGVVTAIEFDVVEQASVYSGAMFYPVERTAELLRAWTAQLPSFPEELTTWLTVLHFPPAEEVPEVFRGRSFVIVMGAYLGSEAEGRALLAPLRGLGPVLDTFALGSPVGLANLAMDPEAPLPFRSTTALVDGLDAAEIDAVAAIATAGPALTMIQLRHGGGALSRAVPTAGARATLPGEIVVFGLGVTPDASASTAVDAALDDLDAAVAARRVGAYPNFVERPSDFAEHFAEDTWRRLLAVKADYDPEGRFVGAHRVPAPAV